MISFESKHRTHKPELIVITVHGREPSNGQHGQHEGNPLDLAEVALKNNESGVLSVDALDNSESD